MNFSAITDCVVITLHASPITTFYLRLTTYDLRFTSHSQSYPGNIRTNRIQSSVDILIAPVNLLDIMNDADAIG